MDYAGLPYSGEYSFINSEMYWLVTHQVAPAEEALLCTECHSKSGRLDYVALGYSEEEAVQLASFPPEPIETIRTEVEDEPVVSEYVEKKPGGGVVSSQVEQVSSPIFAPPPDTLGEPELEPSSGLTPLMWIIIVGVAIVIAVVAIVLIVRITRKRKTAV